MPLALLATLALGILTLLLLATLRLIAILPPYRPGPQRRNRRHGDSIQAQTHLLIVLGSGGHTAEMVAMLRKAALPSPRAVEERGGGEKINGKGNGDLQQALGGSNQARTHKFLRWSDYAYRTWVVSSGDSFSAARAREFEAEMAAAANGAGQGTWTEGQWRIETVSRARRIHQPLYTTPVSALRCLWECLSLLVGRSRGQSGAGAGVSTGPGPGFPDLILTNGPATATIVILASVVLRFFDVGGCHTKGKMRTVYVESWARVRRLSLSGRLLCRVVDRFLVQWEQLDGVGGRGEYLGVLV